MALEPNESSGNNGTIVDTTHRSLSNIIPMRGTVQRKEILLSEPALARAFRNSFPFVNSRLYVITEFGPNVVDEDKVNEAVATIEEKLKKEIGKISQRRDQVAEILKSNIEELGDQFNPYRIKFLVNTRLSNVYLSYFVMAEEYIRYVKSAWMNGLIDDNQKSSAISNMKSSVRSMTILTENLCGRIILLMRDRRNAIRDSQEKALKERAERAAKKMNVDGVTDKDSSASELEGSVKAESDGKSDKVETKAKTKKAKTVKGSEGPSEAEIDDAIVTLASVETSGGIDETSALPGEIDLTGESEKAAVS